ncbi:MAG TPA: sugar ABC transporter substrate-binding protein [Paenibacillus sp.]|nr:sugar ABC transporter substrate-binding protein [Paenibacillus sp.]
MKLWNERATLGLSMLLSASLLATACGTGAGGEAGKSNDEGEQVTLKYIMLTDWVEKLEPINQAFMKEHPNIKIEMESYPFDQLFEVIEMKGGGGEDTFDVVSVDVPMVSGYGFRDYLLPLDEYFGDDDKAKYIPSAVNAGTYKGQFLAPPMSSSSQLLFYNKKLLSDAGVPLPSEKIEDRMTWEEVVANAQKIVQQADPDRNRNIWGLSFDQISRPYQILALPNALGGKGIGDDGVTVDGVLNSPEWIEAMTFYHNIHNELNLSPKALKPQETTELFKAGNIAYLVGGPWNIGSFLESETLDFGYAPHPTFEGHDAATPTGGWHLGVNKHSKHPAEAVEYIKYITAEAGSEMWFEAEKGPATKALLDAINEDKDGKYAAFPESAFKIIAFEAMNTAVPRPLTPGYREWETTAAAAMEDIRNGADPKKSLDDAVAQLKTALEKYK